MTSYGPYQSTSLSGTADGISALEAEVACLRQRRPFEVPMQLCPSTKDAAVAASTACRGLTPLLSRRPSGWSQRLSLTVWHRASWAASGWEPVRSLDQLFCQASCLSPILREKVRVWAQAVGGTVLRARGDREHVYVQPAGGVEIVKLGNIKSVGRAVEKLYRSYDQVASSFQSS